MNAKSMAVTSRMIVVRIRKTNKEITTEMVEIMGITKNRIIMKKDTEVELEVMMIKQVSNRILPRLLLKRKRMRKWVQKFQ